MKNVPLPEDQIKYVTNFHELVATPFRGSVNAICWKRDLTGDFSEIVNKLDLHENLAMVDYNDLLALKLSEQGQIARELILNDFTLLKGHGASPVLNVIKQYERNEVDAFFPTDVYSFHVDRSPIPTDTFLCTYYGNPSEVLPNSQAIQKILVPEIREELKKRNPKAREDFESFAREHFFDLHYQAKPYAQPLSLGVGCLWRLAVDHPESHVLPCIHRAPLETLGKRLLIIC